MTPSLIQPDELPAWVPGRLTVRSPDEGWDGVSVRGYRYAGSDVEVPPMRDYIVVAYRRGATPMRRRTDGSWIREELGPGDVSLLTRAAESHWVWPEDIEVVHVYLTHDELTATCRQMYEREVAEVELLDEVKANDPLIHRTAMLIAAEARHDDAGSRLLVDSLSCQLAVYILRRHAHIVFREPADTAGLTFGQERIVRDYVREHLRRNIALNDLAAAVGLSRFHFARRFKQSTGQTPHAFVMAERLARSQTLLRRTSVPLPDVAAQCGFSDQSHMNRVFAKHLGITPGQYRVSS
jgi:AraC family transcriptional regulator